jgi:hypothetical protein
VSSNASIVDVAFTQPHRLVPTDPDASVPTDPDASVPTDPDASVPTDPDASVPTEQPYSERSEPPSIALNMSGSQTSRVFELTLQDAHRIITSHQVLGRVLLMEPHSKQTLPFITVTLTEELCGYFTTKRNRVG